MDDPHKHRSSRPHEMSGQHQRDKERERSNRERLSHQQKSIMGSSGSGTLGSSNSGQIKSSSHGGHHRPPIDSKMKPPSRPPPMAYPQPKDILREAATRDSPFGLARDATREYPKDPHLARSEKELNKRDYLMKNNQTNQNEGNSANYDHRMSYNDKLKYEKPRLDPNGRPRIDPTKTATAPPSNRDESKSHLENIKKHLNAGTHDKNGGHPKPTSNHHDMLKSVPKQTVSPAVAPVKGTHSNSYAPPANSDVKVKPEPVTVKEEVQIPPVIKRPSLFSPEKSPPHKHSMPNTPDIGLLSPLISPIETKRERNYSSSSEPELRPVMKKIDQVEGFENVIRDSTIGITKIDQSPDVVGKVKTEIFSPTSVKSEPITPKELKTETVSPREVKQEAVNSNGDIKASSSSNTNNNR